MNQARLEQIVGEWLTERSFPPLTRRETEPVDLDALPSILAVVGPRRAGKTFFLYQLMADLLERGKAERRDVLFVDFEDYRLEGFAAGDIDSLLTVFQQLAGRRPKFLVFDEVQHLPSWGRVLRTLHNRRCFRIAVSGSNSSLLADEIASTLRGRYDDLFILPFSFREFLRFKGIPFDRPLLRTPARGDVIAAFGEYLRHGGYPEVVARASVQEKRKVLQNYYRTVVYRDIAERHNIRARHVLEHLMSAVVASPADLFSISAFAGHLKAAGLPGSKRTIANYLEYTKESFFTIMNEKCSYSQRKRMMNPKKVYLTDWGFSALGREFSENRGKLLENVVAVELRRRRREMFYHKGWGECDFVLKSGTRLSEAIQVTWEIGPGNEARELRGIREAMREHKIPRGLVLTGVDTETRRIAAGKVTIMPVWRWLIEKDTRA